MESNPDVDEGSMASEAAHTIVKDAATYIEQTPKDMLFQVQDLNPGEGRALTVDIKAQKKKMESEKIMRNTFHNGGKNGTDIEGQQD